MAEGEGAGEDPTTGLLVVYFYGKGNVSLGFSHVLSPRDVAVFLFLDGLEVSYAVSSQRTTFSV